jgi:hypothetical protein
MKLHCLKLPRLSPLQKRSNSSDPTTAHVLLDMPASLIQEDALGKGVAAQRSHEESYAGRGALRG